MPRPSDSPSLVAEKVAFREQLLSWFRQAGRDLPWRRTRDPYAILVSEIMLQQTQVVTVIPYYERWLQQFPDFAALARASEPEVLRAWQGLGYYARARNLHAAAKMVMHNFHGALPRDARLIAQLPGAGRYTAGALASFAFNRVEPVVEANIARVLARLTAWQKRIDTVSGRRHLWRTAAALLPATGSRVHNSALMDLGAIICLPRQPRCGECPVRSHCRAENPANLPKKKKQPATVCRIESHAFYRKRGRVLLEQSRARWRGMWILPPLASPPRRSPLLRLDFPFTHHRITLVVFARTEVAKPNEHKQWFRFEALPRLPIPSPHRRALDQLVSSSADCWRNRGSKT
jgi:A/G-specific adenine glycosylase